MTSEAHVLARVLEATEFVAVVSRGPDGPHVVGTWGEYVRRLDPGPDTLVIPAGGYRTTEANMAHDDRVQLLMASRSVPGSSGPGQGCVVHGRGRLETEGPHAEAARRHFPWARAALVVRVEEVVAQL